ncbi:MAG: hypothetical protein LKE51_14375 [Selenomonas sp.]|jgi:uncharacterized membrane-anchored protein|nr:hypothetical protein [Selenomonas sp.]
MGKSQLAGQSRYNIVPGQIFLPTTVNRQLMEISGIAMISLAAIWLALPRNWTIFRIWE